MARQGVFIRTYRVNGPRKSRVPMRLRPVVAFIVLNLVVALFGIVSVLMPEWRRETDAAKDRHRGLQTVKSLAIVTP